jgi:hypothetical protein
VSDDDLRRHGLETLLPGAAPDGIVIDGVPLRDRVWRSPA